MPLRNNNIKLLKKQQNDQEKVWIAVESAQSDDEKNVSDAELGRRLGGISRQAVEAIVKGRKDLTVRRLHLIAEALQVRVRELFDE